MQSYYEHYEAQEAYGPVKEVVAQDMDDEAEQTVQTASDQQVVHGVPNQPQAMQVDSQAEIPNQAEIVSSPAQPQVTATAQQPWHAALTDGAPFAVPICAPERQAQVGS